MRKSFSYRANCNRQASDTAERWIESLRLLYNVALEQRKDFYRTRKQSLSLYDQINQLSELRKSIPEYQIASEALQEPLKILDRAFQAFFRRLRQGQKPGFPRFKARGRYNSITLCKSGWRLDGNKLTIAKIGIFKLRLSRSVEGKVKLVTLRRSTSGKWFVSFSCDEVVPHQLPAVPREIGIDVGIKSFAVDSDGLITENPKHLKASLAELRRKNRTLARRVRGSKRRQEARLAVARVHEKIANQRKDFLHKTANHYIKHYQRIFIEDLNIKGMIRNRHLSRSIADSSWGQFFTFLSYKAEEAGREIVKVRPNGTSQICSGCGEKVPKVLSVRVHSCLNCGLVLDRDHNAALNVLRFGQNRQAVTSVKLADVA